MNWKSFKKQIGRGITWFFRMLLFPLRIGTFRREQETIKELQVMFRSGPMGLLTVSEIIELFPHKIFRNTRDYVIFHIIFVPKKFFMLLKLVNFNLKYFYKIFKLKS